jgi:hypothetical protein
MAEIESPFCPECDDAFDFPAPPPVDRRSFLGLLGGAAAAVALGSSSPRVFADETKTEKKKRPAEEMVKELFSGLNDDQKKKVLKPFNEKGPYNRPLRLGMFNEAIGKVRIASVYTKAQQELIEKIVKAMSSGDDGYRLISRMGKWDGSKSLDGCGATFFGDPVADKESGFVFAGHHLTIRCDGNFTDGIAWAGPVYYGHSPNGWSRGNCFNYQTRSVVELYKALDGKQQEKATQPERKRSIPREQYPSVVFKAKDEDRPGLPIQELSKDQRALVEKVMRTILNPYRQEDVDEVMTIIKKNGGMEKIKLAFYTETHEGAKTSKEQPWSFWRLDGPGFVWNYRCLPHVHTYVNISSQLS